MRAVLLGLLLGGCALFRAQTPAEVARAAILDAHDAIEVAARSCALYRAAVALGEMTPDPVVAAACDEAFPVGGRR